MLSGAMLQATRGDACTRIPGGVGTFPRTDSRRITIRLVTAAAAAATAAAAAGRGQRHLGIHGESHVGHINRDALDLRHQFGGHAEGETVNFLGAVLCVRLIQSQGETRAASAAGGKKHADGLAFLVREVGFQLFTSVFRQSDHSYSSLGRIRGTSCPSGNGTGARGHPTLSAGNGR